MHQSLELESRRRGSGQKLTSAALDALRGRSRHEDIHMYTVVRTQVLARLSLELIHSKVGRDGAGCKN